MKTICAVVVNHQNEILAYTCQSTKSACKEWCEENISAWEKIKKLGARVVQAELKIIDKKFINENPDHTEKVTMKNHSEEIKRICDKCTEDMGQENMDEEHCVSCRDELEHRLNEKNISELESEKERNQPTKRKKRFLTIRHLRTDRFGCVTAACLVTPSENRMEIGLSLCSPSDSFDKAEGRSRALKRMNRLPIIIYFQDGERINDVALNAIRSGGISRYKNARWLPNFIRSYRRG